MKVHREPEPEPQPQPKNDSDSDVLLVKNEYKCRYCDYLSHRGYNLDRHIALMHPTEENDTMSAVCSYCKKAFANTNRRWRHQRTCGQDTLINEPLSIETGCQTGKSEGKEIVEEKIAYLYIIRLRQFIEANEHVYKIGRTCQLPGNSIRRFREYPKGSEIVALVQIPLETMIAKESALKNRLKLIFPNHEEGFEYFIGDPHRMLVELLKLIDG